MYNDKLDEHIAHYGILGMKWGVRRDIGPDGRVIRNAIVEGAYAVGAKLNPRETKYALKRNLTKHKSTDQIVVKSVNHETADNGFLTTNREAIDAINREGIKAHKNAVYDNLTSEDIKALKKYTDAAIYSRSVNSYLATGKPPEFGERANELRATLSKNKVDDIVVYRSTALKFSTDGISKKLDKMGEDELKKAFASFDKNFKGKSFTENRVYSTSTSPDFAIDTWRKVNPNAAKTYNTYLVITTKNVSGVLADGRTSKGGKIVNTRSNQEAILAPSKMTYTKLDWDPKREMFVVHMTAEG